MCIRDRLMICIEAASDDIVIVRYATSDDSAIAGEDYQAQGSVVLIEAGDLCTAVSFPIFDDEVEEATEEFVVNLSAPFNATIADAQGIVTILDTDQPVALPTVSINDVTVNEEDGVAELMICIDATSEELVSVIYITANDLAFDGQDYEAQEAVAEIEAGDLCTAVSFPILDDEIEESTENFIVIIGAPSNATVADEEGIVTILDTDMPVVIPSVSINDVTVNEEDGVAELMICIEAASEELVTVSYITSDDSAISGEDYQSQDGVASIEAGDLCTTVRFLILDDEVEESTENFIVIIGAPSNATIADEEGIVTILDTDQPVVLPSVSINDVTVNEEDGVAELMICIEAASEELVTVIYTTLDDIAISGEDYEAQDGVASIEAGDLCTTVSFPILDDEVEESTETFPVILSAPSNATIADVEGIVTILDTDQPVVLPSVSINDVTVNEEDEVAELMICIDAASEELITVNYVTADNSAIAGEDYQAQDGVALIEAGDLCVAVSFPILNDEVEESTETFSVIIGTPSNVTIADVEGIVTILDTDVPVELVESTLSINDVIVNEEDGMAVLEICLNQPSTEFVYVRYTMSDGSANANIDYVAQSSFAFIAEGNQCTTIEMEIIDDSTEEEDEVVVVNLSTPFNAVIGDDEGTVTILDTDAPELMIPDPSLAIDDVVVFEDEGVAVLTICTDAISTAPITVSYTTANETADGGDDYQEIASVLTIPAGTDCMEIQVPIIDDIADESDEVFIVELSAPTNATIGDAYGTVTILDNDEAIVVQPIELPQLMITDVTVNENEGFAHLQICLDQPAIQAVTVDCITADGTAVEGIDYLQTIDVAIIPVGQTCTQASFRILDDSNAEDTETYVVNLSNVSNAIIADDQAIITILDNDEIESVECPETEVSSEDGNIIVAGLDAPIEIVQIFNASFEVVFQCLNNCEATEIVDNLPVGDYRVRINSYNNTWSLICTEETNVTVLNDNTPSTPLTCAGNITNGGRIAGEESVCGTFNPTLITSDIDPAGGADSRDIEYLWLASTVDCPSEVEDQIPGATDATYDPGPITQTTYFVRCSRRLGCTVWVESNCIVKDVFCPNGSIPEGNESSTPAAPSNEIEACGEINIAYGDGQIEMTGNTFENYHFKVNAIDQGWAVVLGCSADCGYTQTATDLADGRYLVSIYDANWNEICQTEIALTSSLTNNSASSRNRTATNNNTLEATKQVGKTFTETRRTVIEGATQANFKQAQATDINFYPNPVRDILTVDLSALAGQEGKAYLSNQMGQVVKTLDLGLIDASPIQIQMGLLSNGLYHLTIVAEGQLVATEKIMVQQY